MSIEKAIKKLSPLSEISLYILLSLFEKEQHGYGVILRTREYTDGLLELKTASVYAAINRFIDYGLAKYTRDQDGKKYYRITDQGEKFLRMEYKRIKLLEDNMRMYINEEEQA